MLLKSFLHLVCNVHLESSRFDIVVNVDTQKAADWIIPVFQLEFRDEVIMNLLNLDSVGASNHQIVDFGADKYPAIIVSEVIQALITRASSHTELIRKAIIEKFVEELWSRFQSVNTLE